MKTKKLFASAFIGILFFTSNLLAQSYQTGIGLRLGGLTTGLTIKHFINPVAALEGIVSMGLQSYVVTGLYEVHTPVDNTRLFNLYGGVGAHIGFFQDGGSYYYHNHLIYTTSAVVGADGVLGLEYKFKSLPVNISMDIKPFIDFYNGGIVYFDGGLSLRYTF